MQSTGAIWSRLSPRFPTSTPSSNTNRLEPRAGGRRQDQPQGGGVLTSTRRFLVPPVVRLCPAARAETGLGPIVDRAVRRDLGIPVVCRRRRSAAAAASPHLPRRLRG